MCGECPGRHGTGGVARIPNATNDTLMLFFHSSWGPENKEPRYQRIREDLGSKDNLSKVQRSRLQIKAFDKELAFDSVRLHPGVFLHLYLCEIGLFRCISVFVFVFV